MWLWLAVCIPRAEVLDVVGYISCVRLEPWSVQAIGVAYDRATVDGIMQTFGAPRESLLDDAEYSKAQRTRMLHKSVLRLLRVVDRVRTTSTRFSFLLCLFRFQHVLRSLRSPLLCQQKLDMNTSLQQRQLQSMRDLHANSMHDLHSQSVSEFKMD